MPGLPDVTVPPMASQLGLEPDPWSFVGHLVAVFREVRRVLRPDATVWLNMGDCYTSGGRGGANGDKGPHTGLARGQEASRAAHHAMASWRRDKAAVGDNT